MTTEDREDVLVTTGQRGGLAIVFVAAIGVALAMPVLDAEDGEPTRVVRSDETEEPPPEGPEPTEEPTEEPTPEPTEEEGEAGPPSELAAAVPEECLTAQPLPFPGEVVTVAGNADVTWAAVDGGGATRFGVERPGVPATFSPSGNYVAVNDGAIYTRDGEAVATERSSPVWAWSPQADCLFALAPEEGLVVTTAGGDRTSLLIGPLTSFALAPSGDLVVVFADDAALLYDLRSGALVGEPAAIPNPSEPLLWKGRTILFGTRSGAGVDVSGLRVAGGGLIEDVSYEDPVSAGSLARCGDRLLAVDLDGLLFDLDTGERLGDSGYRYARPSCSPEGSFIAVARWQQGGSPLDARLVALSPDGSNVSPIGDASGAEIRPEWGPPDTGVVFLSAPRGGAARVVYARTTGGATLPIKAGRFPGFDWSATAPTGVPGTRI